MPLAFSSDQSTPMLEALLRPRVPAWRALDLAIDDRDEMLDFALAELAYDRDRALVSYFVNGIEQYEAIRRLARTRWPDRPQAGALLDFASGYGRLTRFLVHDPIAASHTVSDILADAMEFQAQRFGVKTILSAREPEEFRAEGAYDLIFVASLFTHLPPQTFGRWLERLAALLTADGLLIFSVHDESVGGGAGEGGIRFVAESESRTLDKNEYGSTWVSEAFVRETVSKIGSTMGCARLPHALGNFQDLYVVSPSALPADIGGFVPKGFLENTQANKEGVHFSGWAASANGAASRVELRLDGDMVNSLTTFGLRPEISNAFPTAWHVVLPHEKIRTYRDGIVTVSCFSSAGHERVLYHGTVEGAFAATATWLSKHLGYLLTRKDHEIAVMKQSRFWQVKERWERITRR